MLIIDNQPVPRNLAGTALLRYLLTHPSLVAGSEEFFRRTSRSGSGTGPEPGPGISAACGGGICGADAGSGISVCRGREGGGGEWMRRQRDLLGGAGSRSLGAPRGAESAADTCDAGSDGLPRAIWRSLSATVLKARDAAAGIAGGYAAGSGAAGSTADGCNGERNAALPLATTRAGEECAAGAAGEAVAPAAAEEAAWNGAEGGLFERLNRHGEGEGAHKLGRGEGARAESEGSGGAGVGGKEGARKADGGEAQQGRPERLVYVAQAEVATADVDLVDVIGTDEMTTCVAVALRHPRTGRTALAHVDASLCALRALAAMLASLRLAPHDPTPLQAHAPVCGLACVLHVYSHAPLLPSSVPLPPAALYSRSFASTAMPPHCIPSLPLLPAVLFPASHFLSLSPAGAALLCPSDRAPLPHCPPRSCTCLYYSLSRADNAPFAPPLPAGTSLPVACALVSALHALPRPFRLCTLALLPLNTTWDPSRRAPVPRTRGLAVHVASGEASPRLFTPEERGPDAVLRSVLLFFGEGGEEEGKGDAEGEAGGLWGGGKGEEERLVGEGRGEEKREGERQEGRCEEGTPCTPEKGSPASGRPADAAACTGGGSPASGGTPGSTGTASTRAHSTPSSSPLIPSSLSSSSPSPLLSSSFSPLLSSSSPSPSQPPLASSPSLLSTLPPAALAPLCTALCGPLCPQGRLTRFYDTQMDRFVLPPTRLMDAAALARQRLSMTDHELLHANSTSPLAEGPDFLPFIRSCYRLLAQSPDSDTLFPSGAPRVFTRDPTSQRWQRAPPPLPPRTPLMLYRAYRSRHLHSLSSLLCSLPCWPWL
ncbi:unnamed protein product [Closterium sp. Yama58-4]|nr:unnamed protein product [Closterium sp. Yama58-4]